MPWRRRHAPEIGTFERLEEGNQSEGSVPDANRSESSDSEHTLEEHGQLNGGRGRALYCGYYNMHSLSGCPNDSSRQRYLCRFCDILCCVERCIEGPTGLCRQCKRAWPNETNGGFAIRAADGVGHRGSSSSVDIGDKGKGKGKDKGRRSRSRSSVDIGDKGKGKGKDKGRRSRSRSREPRLVVVKLPTGQSWTFQGGPDTTILYIKAQLAMRIGLSMDSQNLTQSLPDGATLEDLCQRLGSDDRRIANLVLLPVYV